MDRRSDSIQPRAGVWNNQRQYTSKSTVSLISVPDPSVRERDRMRFPQKAGVSPGSFYFQSLDYSARDRKLNAYLAEFRSVAVDDVKLHRHAGAEFICVTEGKLGLYIRNEETTLAQGDSVYFDSSQQHGYRRVGRNACRALVVIAPSTSEPA